MLRILTSVFVLSLITARPALAEPGILLLAHGGSLEWNARVTALADGVNRTRPTEVAFGMATRAEIQAAIDRLTARGVTEIVAVPFFVSSWSSIITSTEFLLGLRAEAPAALAVFAKMSHGSHGAAAPSSGPAPGGHGAGHDMAAHHGPAAGMTHGPAPRSVDGTTPVHVTVPVRMTPALNDHPIVAAILATRARSISRQPAGEALVIVAHGPNEDDDNRRWLADMAALATQIRATEGYASIDQLTVRDDAPEAVRNQATAELRARVQQRIGEGRRVLVVPLVIAFGGIEQGLRQRLEGLDYAMPDTGLVPDDRLVDWVLDVSSR